MNRNARIELLPHRPAGLGSAILLSLALFLLVPTAAAQTGGEEKGEPLWEIGLADGKADEFALGPGDWSRFSEKFSHAPLFIINRSDPGTDWPYVHPGPADRWAGSQQHVFSILFSLEEAKHETPCRLQIDLADSHDRVPPKLRIEVNGRTLGFEEVPKGGPDATLDGDLSAARKHRIVVTIPAHIMSKGMKRPSGILKPGINSITITNDWGSWILYDRISLTTPASIELAEAPTTALRSCRSPLLLKRENGELCQIIRLALVHHAADAAVTIAAGSREPVAVPVTRGNNVIEVPHPVVSEPTGVDVAVAIDGRTIARRRVKLKPVRRWEVFMLHHTHLDIGYTHVQTEVETMQWKHMEQAIELSRKTAGYPAGARFKWNPEGLWAVDSYLKQALPEKREIFLDAVRKGWIGLDALYGNELTGLCRPEELFELVGCACRLAREHGFTLDSAMISDTPGYTWGIVPALACNGIRYFSMGPNAGHRIGSTLSAWGDRPFYWVSPSGKRKVLCWMAGKGYSWFHGTWRGAATFEYSDIESPIDADKILRYLGELDADDYPYDMVQVRYNIGSDNGPPDPLLPDFVKAWNEKYAYPRFIITTTSEMFHRFEERYGDTIPAVSGDFTPYWEDGAASSALETGYVRDAAERLVTAGALWAMIDPDGFPAEEFDAAWRNVILFNEHTWGAWNSISDPESDFAKGQWAIKQGYAMMARGQCRQLGSRALGSLMVRSGTVETALVINTSSWPRTDLVVLPRSWYLAGDLVKGPDGEPVPSQRLESGHMAFVAREVPPLAAARYTIHEGVCHAPAAGFEAKAEGSRLSSGLLTAVLDETTGAIATLSRKGSATNLVNREGGLGLNDYFYVAGRNPENPDRCGSVTITTKEEGPIMASLVAKSDAPGCRTLHREVRLVSGLDCVDLFTVIDKEKILDKEAVHIAFPFNVPGGTMRIDTPWAVVEPEADQIPGACKNHFTVQRWIDVSNQEYGITWATMDAPLVEVGAIRADPIVCGWTERLEPSATFFSYVMNNYWETNYKAGQEGPTVFRYSIRPHGRYDAAAAARFGTELSQQMIVIPVSDDFPPSILEPLLRVEPAGVLVTSLKPSRDGEAFMVRLFNAGGKPETARLVMAGGAPEAIWLSDQAESKLSSTAGEFEMSPLEIVTLRVARTGR